MAKPAEGAPKPVADVKPVKTKSRTKSAKRSLQRELNRLRNFFSD